ncbi:EF-hand domain-containing protein [Trichostrongylus colubriformis]|uniref:EF-hand domain-containing protein n=1 Tax=Trichostrongylus colubriformis TaxID=6319 RepID=A0AAN8EUC0_TRICO
MCSILMALLLFMLLAAPCLSKLSLHKFADKDAIRDEAHMKEHLKNKIETTATESEERRLFHWFLINDLNHDGNIDGLEIMKSVIHSHDPAAMEILSDDAVEEVVDDSLSSMDLDRNGLIDFAEYKKAVNLND